MITDEMLALAAEEVSCAMVDSVPETEHRFSAGFERKLHGLLRRAEHPYAVWALRRVAVALVCLVTAFGILCAASPTVRAVVVGWVRTVFEGYIQYSSPITTPSDVRYDYRLPEKIGDYSLLTCIDTQSGKFFVYTNSDGRMMQFEHTWGSAEANLFIDDMEDCVHHTVVVNGCVADVYVSPNSERNSVIVWQDSTKTILYIHANENADGLIKLAEQVEKNEIS